MIGSWGRRTAFWMLDTVKGSHLREQYRDIVALDKEDKTQLDRLQNILNYAQKNVPYYEKLQGKQLSDFPVMKKENYISAGRSNFLSREYEGSELHHVYTSGSTGTPFEVVQDGVKRNRVVCDLIHCHEKLGWKLGDRYVFIRNWVSNYKQSQLKSFMQNVHNINITGFDDEQKEKLTQFLRYHKNSVIFGYASAVLDYSSYLERQGTDAKKLCVKLIVCDSDELSHANRQKLETQFNVPVFNRYDNEENGLLGVSRAGDDKIYLNTNSLYFELLKIDCDEPANPGEIGRIVVTDLYNHAMPLIRYELGDLAISNDEPERISVLEQFSGRTAGNLTNIDGRLVSNVTISGAIEPFTGIIRYQVCQCDDNDYQFKYIGVVSDDEYSELNNRLHSCFGEMANIKIINVESIDPGKNGKFKTTIRLSKTHQN